jgi:hypothetical protein
VASSSTLGSGGAKSATSTPLYGGTGSSDHNPSNVPTPGMIGAPNSAFVRIGNDSNEMGSDPGTPGTSSQRVQPVPGPVPNGEVPDPSVKLTPKQQKNLRILRDVLQQKLEAAGVGKDATTLPAGSLEMSDRDSALIQAFIMKYGAQGLLLLQDAKARGYSIGAAALGGWDSYALDENDKTITISTRYLLTSRSLDDQAAKLMEVLSARFGPNPFMSAILGSLDLSKVQPAYILSHPEVFDDAIMESAKKANDENVAYKNFLDNTIEYHLKDQARQWIMQKGVQIAASGVFMMLGSLFSMVKLPKFKAKAFANAEEEAEFLAPNGSVGRVRDPKTGRYITDPANPPSPNVMTDAQRRAAWKKLAEDPNSALTPAQRAEIKARGWRGPQRVNEQGELETMELSHEPIPLRDGGTDVTPRWPADNAAIDPYRQLKK